MRQRGRPLGEISTALLSAAAQGPCTLVQMAQRACVAYDTARFKASALARRGALVALNDGRPRVYATPDSSPPEDAAFVMLSRSFWESPPDREAGFSDT